MARKNSGDALKAKQKKQKIMAGVLGGLFLIVGVFEIPKTMKMMTGKHEVISAAATEGTSTTPTPTPTPTPTGPVSLQAPTLGGAAQEPQAPPATSDGLVDAHVTVSPGEGQLVSFGRFATKDPFAQQVSASTAVTSSGSAPPSSSPTTTTTTNPAPSTGGSTLPSAGVPIGSGSVPPSTTPSAPPPAAVPAPANAVISVNGVQELVTTGTDFPVATPTFHLVSLTATTAKIAIAGGSYATGAATLTIKVGKPVTLMNTADGTRFRIQLFPQGTTVAGTSAAATTPTTTTPAAP